MLKASKVSEEDVVEDITFPPEEILVDTSFDATSGSIVIPADFLRESLKKTDGKN